MADGPAEALSGIREANFRLDLEDALRPLADPVAVQEAAARLLALHLQADRVVYFEVEADNYVARRDYASGVPHLRGEYATASFGPHLLAAFRRGETVVVYDVETAGLSRAERDQFADIQVRAHVGIPLIKGGQFVAGLAVHMAAPRKWQPAEVRLIEETAERTWSAVERVRAEEQRSRLLDELRVQRARWEATVESMLDLVATCDAEGRVDYINPAYQRHIGYLAAPGLPLEEHSRYYQLYHADGTPFAPEDLPLQRAALTGTAVHEVEVLERTSDGREFVGVFNASPLHDGEGHIVGAVVVGRDITERRQAEDAMRQSERRHKFLVGLSDALLALSDPAEIESTSARLTCQHLDVNRVNYLDIEGQEAVVVGGYADGLPPLAGRIAHAGFSEPFVDAARRGEAIAIDDVEDDERLAERHRQAFRAVGIRAFAAVALLNQDGRSAAFTAQSRAPRPWSAAELELIRIVAGRTWSAVERARAEAALRTSEERFRALADNIPQLAWMADANGLRTWYNQRWFGYTGTTPEEMADWGWRKVHHPDLIDAIERRFRAAIAAGADWEDTFPLRGRDGEYRWFLSRAVPIRDSDGRIVRWFGTNTDVTVQRETEEALRRSEDGLRQALAAKDEFLGLVSHELRTPITTVAGLSRFLAQHSGAVSPEDLADTLGVVSRDADRLQALILNMLTLSRLQHDQSALEPLLVRECIADAVQDFAARYPMREVIFHRPAGLPPILGYAPWIDQVIDNLLSNAHKYSPVEQPIEVRAWQDDGFVVVGVRDHGRGVEPDSIESIFMAFERTEWAKSVASGLGLGLAVCRRLLEAQGGTIHAFLPPDGGTEMRFTLPIVEDEDAET